jgi:hypothetical protein
MVTLDPGLAVDQPAVARWLAGRDRGAHVRDAAGYSSIARDSFASVEASVRSDLARVPYTHVIVECEGPIRRSAAPPARPEL